MDRVFFITSVCHDRRNIFRSPRVCELFLQTTLKYRDGEKFLLHEFVVMPDHCHFLLTPARLLSLERVIQLIKGGFSHQVRKQLLRNIEIWQRSFTNQHVRTPEEYQEFRRYIHFYPVEARLCSAPAEYAYSSAHPRWASRMDANPFTTRAKGQVAGLHTHG
jgi:putative transposase